MFISPRQLIEARRHGAQRAVDLAHLRDRFAAQPRARGGTAEQRALALRLRALKTDLAVAFGGVASCAACARRCALPAGRWAGGRCCGSVTTSGAFTLDDVRSLKLGGVRAGRLALPTTEQAGCAFRGSRGCSLEPADRPSACLVFLCDDLRAELEGRSDGEAVEQLRLELSATFDRFCRAAGLPGEIGAPERPWVGLAGRGGEAKRRPAVGAPRPVGRP